MIIRRASVFLLTLWKAVFPLSIMANTSAPTIQEVMDLLLAQSATGLRETTVDTAKSGDPSVPVTGVVTCFMANTLTVEEAIEYGANLIITHEPTYYNHFDSTGNVEGDPTYESKRQLLEEHGIVVFRFHDHMHQMSPDPILQSNAEALGWMDYQDEDNPHLFIVPPQPLHEVVTHLKAAWKITDPVKVLGDADQSVSRIGIVPGAYGGQAHIRFTQEGDFDLLIVGEVNEWETPEYYRDSTTAGHPRALVVTGHAVSESLGMAWLAQWLAQELGSVPVHFVATPGPFDYH